MVRIGPNERGMWWPRRERGQAIGIASIAAGSAMLVMWLLNGWVGEQFGWRAAFCYPPLLIGLSGVVYFLVLDAHGYFYAGLQAVIFGGLLHMSGSPWPLVFLLMAGTRVPGGVLTFFVRA